MLRIEAGKWFRKLFVRGTNSDVDPNVLPEGVYTNSYNMRSSSTDGNTGSLKKIKGEVLLYSGTAPGALTYVCIGIASTNGHLVTFWANAIPGFPPIIQVDGVDMAMSDLIPYRFDRPLQMAIASDCGGGTIYTADHWSPPLFWSVQSLIDQYNLNSGYYFGGFSLSTVTVGLNAEAEFPITKQFDTLVDLGGSVGLPPGQYSYSLRYVTPLGDRTNWGMETPLIPVPAAYVEATSPPSMYPGGRTYGSMPNLLAPTRYGIRMYFRIFNPNGFESIEIKRRRYNDGAGLTGAGNEEVIARIPIIHNQFTSEYVFEDPVDSNLLEPLAPDEVDNQVFSILRPKTVEYAERRVLYANFDIESSIPELIFTEVDGNRIVPITRKLTKFVDGQEVPDGYDNPWQAAYHKRYQSDERYTPCIQLYNGNQGKFFAQTITDNFLFPNLHDPKTGDSLLYSDARCDAPTTTGVGTSEPVDATFQCVTQGTQVKKDVNTNINVAAPGAGVNRWGDYYNLYGNPGGAPGETAPQVVGAEIFYFPTSACYRPWDPRDNQAGSGGYNIPPNTSRLTQWPAGTGGVYTVPPGPPTAIYQDQVVQGGAESGGTVFAPTYHSTGMLIYGIDNIPDNVTGFSVGRTKAAGRVIAQGIGIYSISPAPLNDEIQATAPGSKSTVGWTAFFPDMAQGIVDQATIEDIQNFPQNYALRAVSPRGFYSEVFGYCGFANGELNPPVLTPFPWCGPCMGANGMDMISYARIQEDHGQVNVGEPGIGGMGVQPGPNSTSPDGNYPSWSNWRTNNITDGTPNPPPTATNYSYWHESADKGNALLTIMAFAPRGSEARGSSWSIQTNQYVYTPAGDDLLEGGSTHTAFNDPVVKRFHEPWYIIQILRLNAMVPQANSTPFINTGVNIKMRSCIGIYGDPNQFGLLQDFKLLNERWEDCVNYLGTDYRYTYLQPTNAPEEVYLCVTGNTQINISVILNDIASPQGYWLSPDGKQVRGLYQQIIDNNGERYLRFGFYGPAPPDTGTKIFVRYDKTAPIRAFGGDTTVSPVVFSPIDREATFFDGTQTLQSDNSLQIGGMPLPYPGFGMNPRWFMPEKSQTEEQIFINYCQSIRQWVVMFDCETKQQPALLVNSQSIGTPNDQSQLFPQIHYIARRYKEVDFSNSAAGNGFFAQYDGDYPGEVSLWRLGGFRFLGQINYDYAKLPDAEFVGIPKSGFTEKTHFCTGFIASNEFKFTQQDVPGLRTFTIQNLTEISEETGEVKLISSASSDLLGQNIYWWTEKGHGYILTNKSVLTNSQGQLIGTQNTDQFWNNPVFTSRNIGLPGEFWRMLGKGTAPMGDTLVDSFFWPDRDDVYRMTPGGRAIPIGRNKWLKELLPTIRSIGTGYDDRVTGFYDPTKQEYLLCCIPSGIGSGIRTPYVFSARLNEWQGSFGHIFDRYAVHQGQLVGGKRIQTFLIDSAGHLQNTQLMVAFGETVYAPEPGLMQEAQSFRFHPSKPTRVEIYDKDHNLAFFTDQATQEAADPGTGADWILKIDGWEALAGRKNTSIDPDQNRVQDEVLYLRVYYTVDEESILATAQLQLQQVV